MFPGHPAALRKDSIFPGLGSFRPLIVHTPALLLGAAADIRGGEGLRKWMKGKCVVLLSQHPCSIESWPFFLCPSL